MDEKHYVPAVKWKAGEQKALTHLNDDCKESLTPLLEIVPVPWDYENECPAKSLDEHLGSVANNVKSAWGTRPFFIDLCWLDSKERMRSAAHPLRFLMDAFRDLGLSCIPVTSPSRDDDYQQEVKHAINQDGRGVCVRLRDDHFDDFQKNIHNLLNKLRVTVREVDLIIDFAFVNPKEENRLLLSIRGILSSIPDLLDYRSLVFCATSFPENLSEIPSGTMASINRLEWLLWERLATDFSKGIIGRLPSFGDYAIANPSLSEIDPRLMRMTANMRYTVDDKWIILKGRVVKDFGYDQMYDLCSNLVKSPHYCGQSFSWGDQQIYGWGTKTAQGPGNATAWRAAATNHHLTLVVKQVADYFSTLRSPGRTS